MLCSLHLARFKLLTRSSKERQATSRTGELTYCVLVHWPYFSLLTSFVVAQRTPASSTCKSAVLSTGQSLQPLSFSMWLCLSLRLSESKTRRESRIWPRLVYVNLISLTKAQVSQSLSVHPLVVVSQELWVLVAVLCLTLCWLVWECLHKWLLQPVCIWFCSVRSRTRWLSGCLVTWMFNSLCGLDSGQVWVSLSFCRWLDQWSRSISVPRSLCSFWVVWSRCLQWWCQL